MTKNYLAPKIGLKWFLIFFGLTFISLGSIQFIKNILSNNEDVQDSKLSTIPDFHLEAIQGKSFDLSEHPAKLTIMHFWARWCGVCMKEMPALIEFVNDFQKKGVQVFGINVDERPDIVIPKTVLEFGLNFPNFTDKGNKISEFFNLHGIPLTVIYNQKRKILAIQGGEIQWRSAKMQKRIDAWLNEKINP